MLIDLLPVDDRRMFDDAARWVLRGLDAEAAARKAGLDHERAERHRQIHAHDDSDERNLIAQEQRDQDSHEADPAWTEMGSV
jgi:hypothetical protein